MKKAVLEVRDVTKKVKGRTLLSHMSFSVYKNEICGFVGPNGSGKTTLIRTIMGLIRPNEGEILVNGISVQKNRKEALQHVGAIVEAPIFFPYMSGRKNLRNLGRITLRTGGEVLE
ncbi:TPA: ATP-binding cassette domain-containing protein, partial [Streptococcus pneumoniae]